MSSESHRAVEAYFHLNRSLRKQAKRDSAIADDVVLGVLLCRHEADLVRGSMRLVATCACGRRTDVAVAAVPSLFCWRRSTGMRDARRRLRCTACSARPTSLAIVAAGE